MQLACICMVLAAVQRRLTATSFEIGGLAYLLSGVVAVPLTRARALMMGERGPTQIRASI